MNLNFSSSNPNNKCTLDNVLTELIYIYILKVFNSQWPEIIFWKFNFWARSLMYQNKLETEKATDVTSENVLYFSFWVSCLYTFNPLSSLLKRLMTLVATTYRNMESRQFCRTTYMMRIKDSERRPFFKFLDGMLFCTIHTRQLNLW